MHLQSMDVHGVGLKVISGEMKFFDKKQMDLFVYLFVYLFKQTYWGWKPYFL